MTETTIEIQCRTLKPGETLGMYGIEEDEIIEYEPVSHVHEHHNDQCELIREINVWYKFEKEVEEP